MSSISRPCGNCTGSGHDLGFEYLRSEAATANRIQEQKQFSLKRSERQKTREELDSRRLSRLNLYRESVGEAPLSTLDELNEERESAEPMEVTDAHRVKQEEAANILVDVIRLQRKQLMTQNNPDGAERSQDIAPR